MRHLFVRVMNADGKYHYGNWTTPASRLGPLFRIAVAGTGILPDFPPNPATVEQHEKWLAILASNGFTADVTPIEETDA